MPSIILESEGYVYGLKSFWPITSIWYSKYVCDNRDYLFRCTYRWIFIKGQIPWVRILTSKNLRLLLWFWRKCKTCKTILLQGTWLLVQAFFNLKFYHYFPYFFAAVWSLSDWWILRRLDWTWVGRNGGQPLRGPKGQTCSNLSNLHLKQC